MRACADCGADISALRSDAQRCKSCVSKRGHAKRDARLAAVRAKRVCLNCGANIGNLHHKMKRCLPCAEERGSEQARVRARAWHAANRVRARARNKAWRAANPDRARALAKAWNASNSERTRTRHKEWRISNPDKYRAKKRVDQRVRRAKKLNQLGTVQPDSETYLMELQGSRCAAPDCRQALKAKPRNFHLDHIHPISLGGLHDDLNLQLLCAPCNMSKGAKDPAAWLMEHGELPLLAEVEMC